ncbi:MAG TPA: DUF2442 domain-containing protein [Bryobacteraceae bacterium]|nr:DUF2442 domain-containing protein [Bryobacteraceae bacterium]
MQGSEVRPGERVTDVRFTEDTLAEATPEQLKHWERSGAGYGIYWPDLDEDLSTEGLLRGAPAAREASGITTR